jgi:tetratricopeptide (TPR) repeat protein
MDPDNADALVMLGDILLNRGEAEEAGELLYRAVDQNPRDPQLWIQAAGAFLQSGNHERSVAVSDEGLLLFPGFVPLLRLSGYALMETYQNREAIARFEEATGIIQEDQSEAETELADLLGALGVLYTRTGEYEAADRAYRSAIESDPNNAVVLNNYAFSLADRGVELKYAESLAQRAVELQPDSAAFLDTMGWVHFKRGDHESARTWLTRAAQQDGASAAVYEHLGDACAALGASDEARQAWNQALEMNPDNASLVRKLGSAQ